MTPTRLLVAPADPDWADRFLDPADPAARWARAGLPDWPAVAAGFPPGWAPDAVLVRLGYASVPPWVWACPAPVVALAHDPNLLWHAYAGLLPLFDLVLTDAPAAARLDRAGVGHARPAVLYGLDRRWLAEAERPDDRDRDVDVLFVGSLNPVVQGARLPWVGRVARLADRLRVVVREGVWGADYRALVRRAKVCFNRAIRGECNHRAFEAAAGGAVLFQEADNAELSHYLTTDAEYVRYADRDLEELVLRLVGDEPGRRRIAERARARARGAGWLALVRAGLAACGGEWDAVRDRAARRAAAPPRPPLAARVWQRASLAVGPDADPDLAADLAAAGDDHARAVIAATPGEAEPLLARAAATGNRVSLVGRATALAALGRRAEAADAARAALAALDTGPTLSPAEAAACPYPRGFDPLRVGWEGAGWGHPDDPAAAAADKARCLRGRAAGLLAELTGEVAWYAAAAAAQPDLAAARAAYGCALARAGRYPEAAAELAAAAALDPFDPAAAAARVAALADAGRPAEAERAAADRELVRRAAGGGPGGGPAARVVTLSREEFAARFGAPDTAAALCGFTPPSDTHAVLALVAHLRPLRVLEVGTAAGHMTANLCTWTPPGAVVYSVGVVDGARSGAAEQGYEVPARADFARHADHFGTAAKAMLVTADTRAYDFARFAPLDFAFVDGGHDLDTARSDTAGAYAALRPGGCLVWHDWGSPVPWVRVAEAALSLGLPEPVYRVAGTEVAFLFKGEGVGAAAGPDLPRVAVAWDGEFAPAHSLAAVNRGACAELAARGQAVALLPGPTRTPAGSAVPPPPELAGLAPAGAPPDATVRHRWPPDLTPPAGPGAFVLYQPWEYGRVPRAWVAPIVEGVDEVWAYSRAVERAYVASGVPADRVAVVPPGVDPDRFQPGLDPLPLRTGKRVRLLFVGGTIWRKGFDVLLAAYRRAFGPGDDVCLVVKDFGAGTFYRGQTAGADVAALAADPAAPAVEYLADDLSEADLPRLYAACDALVAPYRGEGFALPVLEAMACGLPVVVTAGGPTDEFAPPAAGWRVPARVAYFPEEAVDGVPTAGRPWWLEPDADALAEVLRAVVADPGGRARRGAAARRAALGWTWARTAAAVEDRVRALRNRTPVRFRRPRPAAVPPAPAADPDAPAPVVVAAAEVDRPPAAPVRRPRVSLTMIVKDEEYNLPECLGPVRDLVDEVVVVDTGSADRTTEVAARFGARVSEFRWVDSFAAARNAALDRAAGEWVFWMDADDRVDPENRTRLAALFRGLGGGNAAYVMSCLCVPDAPGAAGTAVDHVRLFRADPRHRWSYRVHEQILPALRRTGAEVRWSGATVRHVGYVDPAVRRRKLARDRRLLDLDLADRPGDPFTLFNLGAVHHELGDPGAAAAALEGSLAGSDPRDSIVRKAWALLARCRRGLGDRAAALAACRAGRAHYPDDAELLFVESGLLRDAGDAAGAEALLLRLVRGSDRPHFGSVDTGLRGAKGWHNLGCLYLDGGRVNEAAGAWRAAVGADPAFAPAWGGLGEVALRAGDAAGVDRAAAALRGLGPEAAADAEALVGRARAARGEVAAAAAGLRAAAARFPGSVAVRVALMQALIRAAAGPEELEPAIRAVLAAEPSHPQAQHNLEVLLRTTGRWAEGDDPHAHLNHEPSRKEDSQT